jgi:hypothetical protein
MYMFRSYFTCTLSGEQRCCRAVTTFAVLARGVLARCEITLNKKNGVNPQHPISLLADSLKLQTNEKQERKFSNSLRDSFPTFLSRISTKLRDPVTTRLSL